MAVRNILKGGDDALRKVCRSQLTFDDRLATLLDDMADGCGLAASQIGVLRRVCVVDVGDGLIELVNPVIVEQSGLQFEEEGCLSFPGDYGKTKRPMNVTVRAQDRNGNTFTVSGTGLKARAFCHELDHLDGVVFKDRLIKG